jgi:hypothetical protein
MPVAAIPTVLGSSWSRVEPAYMMLIGHASDPGMLLVCTVSRLRTGGGGWVGEGRRAVEWCEKGTECGL